jgi:hypothetical protein
MRKPFVVISGLPGSGKTTLGRRLAPVLRMPLMEKNDILDRSVEWRGVGNHTMWLTSTLRRRSAGLRTGSCVDALPPKAPPPSVSRHRTLLRRRLSGAAKTRNFRPANRRRHVPRTEPHRCCPRGPRRSGSDHLISGSHMIVPRSRFEQRGSHRNPDRMARSSRLAAT